MKGSALSRNRFIRAIPGSPLRGRGRNGQLFAGRAVLGCRDRSFDFWRLGYDSLRFELLDLFLKPELPALQLRDFKAIDERAVHFRFDLTVEGLVLL